MPSVALSPRTDHPVVIEHHKNIRRFRNNYFEYRPCLLVTGAIHSIKWIPQVVVDR
jgi:hypothetical protein